MQLRQLSPPTATCLCLRHQVTLDDGTPLQWKGPWHRLQAWQLHTQGASGSASAPVPTATAPCLRQAPPLQDGDLPQGGGPLAPPANWGHRAGLCRAGRDRWQHTCGHSEALTVTPAACHAARPVTADCLWPLWMPGSAAHLLPCLLCLYSVLAGAADSITCSLCAWQRPPVTGRSHQPVWDALVLLSCGAHTKSATSGKVVPQASLALDGPWFAGKAF